jgi:predicted ABC-type ATPase
MNQDNDKNNPTLIIIRGLPGSGKSFIAEELLRQFSGESIVLLDPDMIDNKSKEYTDFTKDLENKEVDPKLFPYRFLRNKAYETIDKRGVIIWTQAFTNQDLLDKTIKNLSNYSSQKSYKLRVLVVDVEIEENIARERIKKREELGLHGVSDENFKRFVNDYSPFENYGYDLLTLNGKKDVSSSVEIILSKLRSI